MSTYTYDSNQTVFTGTGGTDTLVFNTSAANLTSSTLNSIEILKAGLASTSTWFVVDQNDLAANGSVIGSSKADLLATVGTTLDLSATKLTSIEVLDTGNTHDTTFTVDQADLASGGAVWGNNGNDTLKAFGVSLDLTSTGLLSLEILRAGQSKATTFTVDKDDLTHLQSITGSSGVDTLVVKDAVIDLSGIKLNSIETLKAGTAAATTITLDDPTLLKSIVGTAKGDTLVVTQTTFYLADTTLSSIETLKAGTTNVTNFIVNQADLAKGGAIIGSTSGGDTIGSIGSSLDLTSTTLTGIETLQPWNGESTTFTVAGNQLPGLGSIYGSGGADTLIVKGTDINLSAIVLSGIDTVKAGLATATTFDFSPFQLGDKANLRVSAVVGGAGVDTLTTHGTTIDLSSTTVTSIEKLLADPAMGGSGVVIVVDQADLAKGGTITGTTSTQDKLLAAGTALDLTSSTVTSIEILGVANSTGSALTVTGKQFAGFTDFQGSNGADTLIVKSSAIDLTSTTLVSIESLKTGVAAATTFTVNSNDLVTGGGNIQNIVGGGGVDTLTVAGKFAYLDNNLSLTSIEKLVADPSNGTWGTLFSLKQDNLANHGSIVGNAGATDDTVVTYTTTLDLSSTVLTSIEKLQLNTNNSATLTVSGSQLHGLTVTGGFGTDTLAVRGTLIDLTSTTLMSLETLEALSTTATTFKVDLDDIHFGLSPQGNKGINSLDILGTDFDLSQTMLTSIERLQADTGNGTQVTTFTLDQADLASGGSVIGNTKIAGDILKANGTALDLTSTTLSGIEILQAGTTNGTIFTVDQADVVNVTVQGTAKIDMLQTTGTALDLTSTNLSSIEILNTTSTLATTFTVDPADLASALVVVGSVAAGDTLVVKSTAFDLSSNTISNIEILKAGVAAATTFTVNQADLANLGVGGMIVGGAGSDTVKFADTQVDLTSTTLTSIETLSGAAANSIIKIDAGDVVKFINGGAGNADQVQFVGSQFDLTSTTLSGIEVIANSGAQFTVFKVDQADLAAGFSGIHGAETLMIHGTAMDLSGTFFSGIAVITTDSTLGTTFKVTQANLDNLTGVAVVAGSGKAVDTLVIHGNAVDLTSVSLSSIEKLTTDKLTATTFTVDQGDLAALGSIVGSTSAGDTLVVKTGGTTVDLGSVTLSNIETIKTATATGAVGITIQGGEGGATLDLTVNNKADTIHFGAAYKAAVVTNSATILAHTLSLDHFGSSDVIDLSALDHGTPAHSADITGSLGSPATLKAALDIAAAGNGGVTADIVTFQYGGDTYVVVDNSAGATLTANDAVIKLVGAHTLVDATNFTF